MEGSKRNEELIGEPERLKADFIPANPPFNLSDWNDGSLNNDQRWKYGLPPSGNSANSPGDMSQPTEPQTQQPSGNLDPKLIGSWYDGHISGSLYDRVTGQYIGGAGLGRLFIFYDDGAYVDVLGNSGMFGSFMYTTKGKYRVNGNRIEFYECFTDSVTNDITDYTNKPSESSSYAFELGSDEYGDYFTIVWNAESSLQLRRSD